jgi:transposase-like protein
MEKKIAPSERKAQEIQALMQGQLEARSGEELLSTLVRLSTERVLQEALEDEQALALGRERYERRNSALGYRNGYESGTLKTAEGVLRVQVPQSRGGEEP